MARSGEQGDGGADSAADDRVDAFELERSFDLAYRRLLAAADQVTFGRELSHVLGVLEQAYNRWKDLTGQRFLPARESEAFDLTRAVLWARHCDVHRLVRPRRVSETYQDTYSDTYATFVWTDPGVPDPEGHSRDVHYRTTLLDRSILDTLRPAMDVLLRSAPETDGSGSPRPAGPL